MAGGGVHGWHGAKLGARPAVAARERQCVGGHLPRLSMDGQLEAIGEQRSQHLQHLLLGRCALDSAFDVESIGVDPVGSANEFLHRPIGEPDRRVSA